MLHQSLGKRTQERERERTNLLHQRGGFRIRTPDQVLVNVLSCDRLQQLQVLLVERFVLGRRSRHVNLTD